jgi:hypothetical protein
MSESSDRRVPRQSKKRLPGEQARHSKASRSCSARSASDEAEQDPLGKLIEEHRMTLAGVIVVCGVLAGIGGTSLWWGWAQRPRTLFALSAMGIGAFVLLMALVLLFTNVFNVGRSLELRKHGIRYTERGQTKEFRWNEIAAVETDRLDSTNLGVATKYTRSNNAAAPSGPLTRSEFTVTIVADDGRTIRLPPSFLRSVGDPRRLISNLKLRSGV